MKAKRRVHWSVWACGVWMFPAAMIVISVLARCYPEFFGQQPSGQEYEEKAMCVLFACNLSLVAVFLFRCRNDAIGFAMALVLGSAAAVTSSLIWFYWFMSITRSNFWIR